MYLYLSHGFQLVNMHQKVDLQAVPINWWTVAIATGLEDVGRLLGPASTGLQKITQNQKLF
jgi:hypothetical protein